MMAIPQVLKILVICMRYVDNGFEHRAIKHISDFLDMLAAKKHRIYAHLTDAQRLPVNLSSSTGLRGLFRCYQPEIEIQISVAESAAAYATSLGLNDLSAYLIDRFDLSMSRLTWVLERNERMLTVYLNRRNNAFYEDARFTTDWLKEGAEYMENQRRAMSGLSADIEKSRMENAEPDHGNVVTQMPNVRQYALQTMSERGIIITESDRNDINDRMNEGLMSDGLRNRS